MAWTIEERRRYKREWSRRNRGRYAKQEQVWREKNKQLLETNRIKRNLGLLYGITPEDYDAMFAAQKGRCAICRRHQTEFKRRLAVDHNHDTDEVRSLLCGDCNGGLGMFFESPKLLERVAAYPRGEL